MAAFQYAAKFVCGKSDGDELAPGVYFTAINVHNPTERDVTFRKKFAVPGRDRRLGFPAWHPGDRVRVWVDGPVNVLGPDAD